MNNFSKKAATVALSLVTVMAFTAPAGFAGAQTASDLQTKIAALLSQVQTLQGQLGTSGTPSTSCYSFTRSLTVGSKGADVTALQNFLSSKGYLKVSATGYFGSLTKTAVAAWQKAASISPASGYFGSISRAAYASACSTAVVPVTPSNPTNPTTPMTPTPVTGQVTVTAGSNQGGSIISGAAQVPVLSFTVSNGTNQTVTVTGAKFTKTGVVSDSNISNAYLSIGSNIVAQYVGLSNGVVTFSGNLFDVPAGQSVSVMLRMDISSGTSNGNTVGFNLASASDLTLSAGTVAGSFPVAGGTYVTTSVSNPSLASLSSVQYQSVAGQVDAGTTGFRAGALSMTVQNSAVKLQSVRFTVSGSINYSSDLKNLVLKVDGNQVATAAGLTSDGAAFFDLSSAPAMLGTGSHTLEVYTDVMGTPNRQMTFQVLRPFDWVFTDSQYNTNISGGTPGGTATSVSIRQGSITSSLDSSTPTGNVALGATNVTIAKFAIRAAGEPVKVMWMPFKITEAGSGSAWTTGSNVDADIRNIALYADDGQQLGTTINTPSSCTYGTPALTSTSYTCSFGSSSSNINYIIPANTTRVLSLKVDIQSGADISSIKGSLVDPTTSGFTGNNVQGQISFQTSMAPGGVIDGSTLTISTSPFQAAQNSAFSSQTYVGGAYGQKIGSYSLSASSAEGINVTSLTVQTSADVNKTSGNSLKLQNLVAKVGSTQWNYVVPSVSPSTSYTFASPSGATLIPAGGSVVVDVYADVLSGSSQFTATNTTALVGAVGTGATTNTNQTLKNTAGTAVDSSSNKISGQNVTVAGTGSLTLSVNTQSPASQQIVMGSTGATLGQFRFTTDNNEDVKLQTLVVTASSTTGSSSPIAFKNLALYDGSTLLGSGTAMVGSSGIASSTFNFATPVVIAKNTTKEYVLKGDVASYSDSPSADNNNYAFQLTNSSAITAFGAASNQSVGLSAASGQSFPLAANVQTVYRTKLTAALAQMGTTSGRVRTANDDVATLTLNADQAYGATFKAVKFTLSGAVLNATNTFTLALIDSSGNTATSTSVTTAPATTSVAVTLNVPTSVPFITAGGSQVYKVRVDSSSFANASQTSDSFSIQIASPTDLTWTVQGDSTNRYLQTNAVPLTSTVSYE